MRTRTFTATFEAPASQVFAFLSRVENLLTWAPAFADSITGEQGRWLARKGAREFEVRLASDEATGVIDFQKLQANKVVAVSPSRVVANGSQAEYIFTLFQVPELDDEAFEQTIRGMEHEFATLRTIFRQA